MKQDGQLKRLAAELKRLVSSAAGPLEMLDDAEAAVRPSPGEWSKKEVIGHLIDSAANNHQRFVRALHADRLVFPAYEQEQWVACQHHNRIAWEQLLAFWRAYNLHLVHLVLHIPEEKIEVPCTIGSDAPVSLGFLVEDYMAHMKLHFEQLQLSLRE